MLFEVGHLSQRHQPAQRAFTIRRGGVDQRMAPEDACSADMLVMIRWQGRTMAVPLSQLIAIDADDSSAEAIGDWHNWVAQGYCF